jgi:hypothetical protein
MRGGCGHGGATRGSSPPGFGRGCVTGSPELIVENERLKAYNDTATAVHTERLAAEEVEYLRWRAERWIKLRHMPVAFLHNPWFVLRSAPRMFAHSFRGSTLKSLPGFEEDRRAFERYRTIRQEERAYI